MTEQQRPGDQTGQDMNRYPGAPAGQQHPQAGPQVPPHQGWTGQQQPYAAQQHPYAGQQQAYPGQQPTGQHWTGTQQAPPVFTPAGGPVKERRSRGWRIAVAGLAAGALIGGGTGAGVATLVADHGGSTTTAAAQNVVITDPQNATSATAAAAKAAPSVVTVYVTSGQSAGSGSGVVMSADGYVVTNNHVVTLDSSTNSATVQVTTSDGTLYDATVVGTDPTSDLAVIKLEDASGLTPATFADSGKVQVGDQAIAIGAPLGLSNTVTTGIVSALDRAVSTGSDQNTTVIDAIQTDAAINPGNSGGALVNAAGEVIGINSAIASVANQSSQEQQSGNIGVGFAIPSDTAQRVAQQIIQTGSATHALLGVSAQTAAEQGSEVGEGAKVAQVADGGPAAQAGIQVGDVITAVGSREVTTSTDLTAAVRSATPGEKVTLTVRRGSSTEQVDVTLGTASS